MKIFYIAAELELASKPKWLDKFRKKYDEPHPYHITLKNPCWVDKKDISKLKSLFFKITEDKRQLKIKFSRLKIAQTDNGYVIMVGNETDESIRKLQKEIAKTFSQFGKHIEQKYTSFEKEFEPHITIARRLNSEGLEKARKELSGLVECVVYVKQIVLTIVKKWDVKEQNKSQNRTITILK
jgi:2'-5' RNA ligase